MGEKMEDERIEEGNDERIEEGNDEKIEDGYYSVDDKMRDEAGLDWKAGLRRKLDLGKIFFDGLSWPMATQLSLLVFATLIFLFLAYDSDVAQNMQNRFRHLEYSNQKPPDWSQESHGRVGDSSKVKTLLEEIRRVAAIAGAGEDYSMTPAEEADWHAKNPCASRAELPLIYEARKSLEQLPDHHFWDEVLTEYSKLHRTCMKRVGGNVTAFFKSNIDIPGCNFLITEPTNGLGNKLLVLTSGLMYAIATKRIFLLTTIESNLLCEPFVGSSWIIEGDFPQAEHEEGLKYWVHDDEFLDRADVKERLNLMKEGKICYGNTCPRGTARQPPLARSIVVASNRAWWLNWQPKEWFYCNMEQELVADVPWIYFSGCIYSAPKLLGSPAFGPLFHALFPKNMVLTTLLRTTCLPADIAWARFKRLNRAYFKDADRRVGLQLRYFGDAHEKKGQLMVDRVMDCMLNNKVLPNISSDVGEVAARLRGEKSSTSSKSTVVYIASLFAELRDRLNEFYIHSPTETQEDVTVVQLTAHRSQESGLEEDREALVEMLLLSTTDSLLVTPASTFGGIAQAYGGIVPWFVRARDRDDASQSPCQRASTIDVCQQGGRLEYKCAYDKPSDTHFSPSIVKCLEIDANGVTILTG